MILGSNLTLSAFMHYNKQHCKNKEKITNIEIISSSKGFAYEKIIIF